MISEYIKGSSSYNLVWWYNEDGDGYYLGYDDEGDLIRFINSISAESQDEWMMTAKGCEYNPIIWEHIKVFHLPNGKCS